MSGILRAPSELYHPILKMATVNHSKRLLTQKSIDSPLLTVILVAYPSMLPRRTGVELVPSASASQSGSSQETGFSSSHCRVPGRAFSF